MHISGRIYMDYQASTPVDERALKAMLPYFSEIFANPHASNHAFGWEAAAAVERARAQIAALIGAYPEDVFFTSGATESNNHVFQAMAAMSSSNRKTILISSIEHPCVMQAATLAAERGGFKLLFIPVDGAGRIDMGVLNRELNDDVLMVSIMAVNNEVGTVQDIPQLVELAHSEGAFFHCDAAQAFPAVQVDAEGWDVDFLSLSAHKLYGPKGIGALYIRSDLRDCISPLLVGGGQENGVRAGTVATPLCVGFGEAASIMHEDREAEALKLQALRKLFLDSLRSRGVLFEVNGMGGRGGHPGNVSITFRDIHGQHLLAKLQPKVAASSGSACTSSMDGHSHVLAALGLDEEAAGRTVRFSLGRYSDVQQVRDAVDLIAQVINEERSTLMRS